MDILWPLPRTLVYNQFVLPMTYRYMRLARAFSPSKTTNSHIWSIFLDNSVTLYGVDEGFWQTMQLSLSEKLFESLCILVGMKHLTMTVHHLQTKDKLKDSATRESQGCYTTWLIIRGNGTYTCSRWCTSIVPKWNNRHIWRHLVPLLSRHPSERTAVGSLRLYLVTPQRQLFRMHWSQDYYTTCIQCAGSLINEWYRPSDNITAILIEKFAMSYCPLQRESIPNSKCPECYSCRWASVNWVVQQAKAP